MSLGLDSAEALAHEESERERRRKRKRQRERERERERTQNVSFLPQLELHGSCAAAAAQFTQACRGHQRLMRLLPALAVTVYAHASCCSIAAQWQ